jgi:hypothetical protein
MNLEKEYSANIPDSFYEDSRYTSSTKIKGSDSEMTKEGSKGGIKGWVIALIVIGSLIVITAIVLAIIYGTRATPVEQNRNQPLGPVAISGVNIRTLGSNMIQATWTSVSNEFDIVTLYVVPSGTGLSFNENGTPIGNPRTSGPVAAPATTATVTGLLPNVSYDATLIVTNPRATGVISQSTENGLTITGPAPLGAKFTIGSSGQCGAIGYGSTGPDPNLINNVFYQLGVNNPNQSLFHRDPRGYICATTQGQSLTLDSECADNSSVLYDSGVAGNAFLSIGRLGDLDPLILPQARWTYDAAGDNRWCTASNRCIQYNVNSPTTTILSEPDANGAQEILAVTQPLFVTSGATTKWTNTNFTLEVV